MEIDELATAIFHTLIATAKEGDTITYSKLAKIHNLPETGNALGTALSLPLGKILLHCEEHNLPPLTAIVVRKSGEDRGLPGRGFWVMKHMDHLTRAEKKEMQQDLLNKIYSVFNIPLFIICNYPLEI